MEHTILKRLLCFILLLTAAVTLPGCASATDEYVLPQADKQPSSEVIVQAAPDVYDVYTDCGAAAVEALSLKDLTNEERCLRILACELYGAAQWNSLRFCLLDLNEDGVPELLTQLADLDVSGPCRIYDISAAQPEMRLCFYEGHIVPSERNWQLFRVKYPDGTEGYFVDAGNSRFCRERFYLRDLESGEASVVLTEEWDYSHLEPDMVRFSLHEWNMKDGERGVMLYGWSEDADTSIKWDIGVLTRDAFEAAEENSWFGELLALPREEITTVTDQYGLLVKGETTVETVKKLIEQALLQFAA